MKKIYLLLVTVLTLSCKENKKSAFSNSDNKCDCEKTVETDSMFYASNVEIDSSLSRNQIKFNCQLIEVGTASVTDSNGNARCRNMYGLKCSSEKFHQLTFAENFTYTSGETENSTNSKNSFIDDLKRYDIQIFKFYLNSKRELKSASRILRD